ncbi:MAG: hypothetical protein J6T03_05505 [Bacteroidales bacterium]|nr:hypothetical protein [Bacteroidales bacterium]
MAQPAAPAPAMPQAAPKPTAPQPQAGTTTPDQAPTPSPQSPPVATAQQPVAVDINAQPAPSVSEQASPVAPQQDKGMLAQQQPQSLAAADAVKSGLRRVSGISLKIDPIYKPVQKEEPKPAMEMNQENLEKIWAQLLDHLKESDPNLWETLQNRAVRYQGDNNFAVVVNNSFYEAEIKLHLIEMLTFLRNVSGQPLLNCHVEVEQVEHEALIYHPRDKYDTMLKSNPALEHFRVLFPDVDY